MADEKVQCLTCWADIEVCKCDNTEAYTKGFAYCPFCATKHDPADDNHDLYDEETTEFECQSCGKIFNVNLFISHTWSTTKPK